MQLIKHMHVLPVDEGIYMVLNGLTGAMDLIDQDAYNWYLRWKTEEEISPMANEELFSNFLRRNYIMSRAEEERKSTEIMHQLAQGFTQAKKRVDPTFLLTYNCNFRCPYCFEQNVLTKSKEELQRKMTPEMVRGIFAYFTKEDLLVEDILLYGGEPLLLSNEDTVKALLTEAKERDLNVSIITNGYTLEHYLPMLSQVKMKTIQVTIDGDRVRHNQSRYLVNSAGTYDQIISGLKKACEYGIRLAVRCNLEVDEENQIETVKEALQQNGLLDQPNVQLYISPVAREDSKFKCGHDFLNAYLNQLDKFAPDSYMTHQALKTIHRVAVNFLDPGRWKPSYFYCAANVSQAVFDPWGKIYTCQAMVGHEEWAVGSFDATGQITFNETYHKWRNRTVETMTKCQDCAMALFCGGGCTLRMLRENGELMVGNCESMQETYEIFLPYLYRKYLKQVSKK